MLPCPAKSCKVTSLILLLDVFFNTDDESALLFKILFVADKLLFVCYEKKKGKKENE